MTHAVDWRLVLAVGWQAGLQGASALVYSRLLRWFGLLL